MLEWVILEGRGVEEGGSDQSSLYNTGKRLIRCVGARVNILHSFSEKELCIHLLKAKRAVQDEKRPARRPSPDLPKLQTSYFAFFGVY